MTVSTHASDAGPAYGLARPDLAAARDAIQRIYGDRAEPIWTGILTAAGLGGRETDPQAIERLVRVMEAHADPVVALCARALSIRINTHDHLAVTQAIVKGENA